MSKIKHTLQYEIALAAMIKKINYELQQSLPLISQLDNKKFLGVWDYEDCAFLDDALLDSYWERNFTYMLIILESFGE